jgi:shikimate dehydrogenase
MITSDTKLICVIGHPIKHSKSPLMHNAALQKIGEDAVYLAFDVETEKLEGFIAGVRAMGIIGANVTIPHKENIIKYLDGVTKEAEIIGAVNTIYRDGDKLIGDNSDGKGFIISLMKETEFDPKGKKVLILGAGGASKAVTVKLADEGAAEIYLYDIDEKKAKELVEQVMKSAPKNVKLHVVDKKNIEKIAKESNLLVNCTPIGMKESDIELLPEEVFNSNHVVYDLIYNPTRTKLLKSAEKKGAKVVNGLGMLIYQGAISFEKWTGKKPDTDIMFKTIKGE